MRRVMVIALLLVVVAVAAACSDSSTPATTPVVTTPPETSTTMPPTTTSTSTTSTTTTTTLAPPTTVDRLAEVQAIIQDLEERRLDALFREDEEAFRALFANDAYLELSLEVLGNVEFVAAPADVIVEVREILADTGECLALDVFRDLSQTFGPEAVGDSTLVLQHTGSGDWGFSYGGEDWLCAGEHPLG